MSLQSNCGSLLEKYLQNSVTKYGYLERSETRSVRFHYFGLLNIAELADTLALLICMSWKRDLRQSSIKELAVRF